MRSTANGRRGLEENVGAINPRTLNPHASFGRKYLIDLQYLQFPHFCTIRSKSTSKRREEHKAQCLMIRDVKKTSFDIALMCSFVGFAMPV